MKKKTCIAFIACARCCQYIGWQADETVFVLFVHTNLFALYKASSTGKSDDLVILSEWMCVYVCGDGENEEKKMILQKL